MANNGLDSNEVEQVVDEVFSKLDPSTYSEHLIPVCVAYLLGKNNVYISNKTGLIQREVASHITTLLALFGVNINETNLRNPGRLWKVIESRYENSDYLTTNTTPKNSKSKIGQSPRRQRLHNNLQKRRYSQKSSKREEPLFHLILLKIKYFSYLLLMIEIEIKKQLDI